MEEDGVILLNTGIIAACFIVTTIMIAGLAVYAFYLRERLRLAERDDNKGHNKEHSSRDKAEDVRC